MRPISRGMLAAACLLSAFVPAAAQQADKPWDLRCSDISSVGNSVTKCVGNAEFEQGDLKLYADEIEFYKDQDKILARGNVVFSQGRNQIASDSVELNTKTRLGTFYNARGSAPLQPQRSRAPLMGTSTYAAPQLANADDEVHFFGEIVEKVGPKKYKITRGGFTTCLQPTPRWDLSAGTIILNVDEYTFLRNSIFNVKGVPLLYLPVFYYPTDKDGRSTGFLIPTYSASTLRGQSLSNAFFWAINRSNDATFKHDWYSNTGQGFSAEYRYALATGDAVVETYILHDNETVYDNGGTLPGGTSYHIRGAGTQRLPGNLRASFRADYTSSLTTAQTLTTSMYDTSRYQRNFGGNVVGFWRYYSLNGTYERREYLTNSDTLNLTGSSPRIAFSGTDREIQRSGLFLGFTSELAHIDRETRVDDISIDNRTLARFDVAPTIRYPFKRWAWLSLDSQLTYRETFWTKSQDPLTGIAIDDSLNRQFVTMAVSAVGPVFNRVWDTPENGYAEKFKHTIEPYLRFTRTSAIDIYDRVIKLDSYDGTFGGTTRYDYGLRNRFYAKRRTGSVSQAQEILNFEVTQSYYTDSRASLYDPNYSSSTSTRPNNFSPIALNARAMPTNNLSAGMRAEIDSRSYEFSRLALNADYRWPHGSFGGDWSQTFVVGDLDPNVLHRTLRLATSLRTMDNRYGGNYGVELDAVNGALRSQTIQGYYNAQCCGIAMQYQRYNFGTSSVPINTDRRFFISFSLAGLGSFSPFNGALSGIPR